MFIEAACTPSSEAVGLAPPDSFPALRISASGHHNFELCLWAFALYLNMLCASVSKTCHKVIDSLLYAISACERFHGYLSNSGGNMYPHFIPKRHWNWEKGAETGDWHFLYICFSILWSTMVLPATSSRLVQVTICSKEVLSPCLLMEGGAPPEWLSAVCWWAFLLHMVLSCRLLLPNWHWLYITS